MKNKKILFISNHASFFVSHRLNIFNYSHKKNYEFSLIFGNPASKNMEKTAIRELIKKKVKQLNIPFIDIHEDVFQKETNKLKLFPFEKPGHYNEYGYYKVATAIYNFIVNNNN